MRKELMHAVLHAGRTRRHRAFVITFFVYLLALALRMPGGS
jgi:hypothetical protein